MSEMNTYIEVQSYYAMDWHDWYECTYYLGNEYEKYIVKETDIEKLICEDVLFTAALPLTMVDEVVLALKTDGVWHTEVESTEDSYGYDILLNKTNHGYECTIATQATVVRTYVVKQIPQENVVYLPIYELRCAPKISPLKQIAKQPYVEDFDEAVKCRDEMDKTGLPKEHVLPFTEEAHVILIADRIALNTDNWYNEQLKAEA